MRIRRMRAKPNGRIVELLSPAGKLWSDTEDRLSKDEGWALFTADYDGIEVLVIQKIDDPVECGSKQEFASDTAALGWIAEQAIHGRKHCLKALLLHNCPTIYKVFIPALFEQLKAARKRKSRRRRRP